jgi:hypothetical protein
MRRNWLDLADYGGSSRRRRGGRNRQMAGGDGVLLRGARQLAGPAARRGRHGLQPTPTAVDKPAGQTRITADKVLGPPYRTLSCPGLRLGWWLGIFTGLMLEVGFASETP